MFIKLSPMTGGSVIVNVNNINYITRAGETGKNARVHMCTQFVDEDSHRHETLLVLGSVEEILEMINGKSN
jgi:protein gp37